MYVPFYLTSSYFGGSKIISNVVLLHLMFYFWYHSRLSYQIDTPLKTNQIYSKATRSEEIKNIQAKVCIKAELRRANANKQTKNLKAARNKDSLL